MLGCPIRKSSDQILCANPRSLSQLITSFIASESLGIRHTPLLSLLYFLLFCSFTLFFIARLLFKNFFFLVNFLSFTISLFQYVNELVRIVADKSVSDTFLAAFDCVKGCVVENIGVEPMTSCVQGRRSSQLS